MLQSLVQAETSDDPRAVLRRVFGFPGFRGQQEQVVRHVVAGGVEIGVQRAAWHAT